MFPVHFPVVNGEGPIESGVDQIMRAGESPSGPSFRARQVHKIEIFT